MASLFTIQNQINYLKFFKYTVAIITITHIYIYTKVRQIRGHENFSLTFLLLDPVFAI